MLSLSPGQLTSVAQCLFSSHFSHTAVTGVQRNPRAGAAAQRPELFRAASDRGHVTAWRRNRPGQFEEYLMMLGREGEREELLPHYSLHFSSDFYLHSGDADSRTQPAGRRAEFRLFSARGGGAANVRKPG